MSLPLTDLVSLEFRSRGFGRELYGASESVPFRKADEFPEVVEEISADDRPPADGVLAAAFRDEFSKRGFSKPQVAADDTHPAEVDPPEKYLSPLDAAAMMGVGILAAKEIAQSFKNPSYLTPGKGHEFKSLAGPSKNYEADGDDEEPCDDCEDEAATFHGQMGLPGGPENYAAWSESKVSRDKNGRFRKKGFGNSANRKAKARRKNSDTTPAGTAHGVMDLSTNEKVIVDALEGGALDIDELASVTKMSSDVNSPLRSALVSLRDSKHIKSRQVDGVDVFELA